MTTPPIRRPFLTKKRWIASATVIIVLIIILIVFLHPQPHRFYELPRFGLCSTRLNREILNRSLELGTQFLLNNQKPEGNFTYQYDWLKREYTAGDSQVRQAGAMWGLALIFQDHPNLEVGRAVEKAMTFFEQHSKVMPNGARYVAYPGVGAGRTGVVALCALTYVDYLRAAKSTLPDDKFQDYQNHLNGYIKFLIEARTEVGLWHQSYNLSDGKPYGTSSPYFDGEALLALVKTAKYMNRRDLEPIIRASADAGHHHNIKIALEKDRDSRITKGYFQWSSMAFFELATSGWQDTETYGDYLISLADWMIDVHMTLLRPRNTGYAYEGIIPAYQLAVERNNVKKAKKFACVIDTALEKLTSWQVGSPIANRFIRRHPTDDPLAIGGVQNHRRESPLRIDVAQHQMHAVILARRYVYTR